MVVMALGKCPRTGKLYDKSTGPVHPSVMAEEEAEYSKILDYVADHPNCEPTEVVEETGVPLEVLQRLVKQGRVEQLTSDEVEAKALDQAKRADETNRIRQRIAEDLAKATRGGPGGDAGDKTSVRDMLQEKRRS